MGRENLGVDTTAEATSADVRKKRVTLAEYLTNYVPEGDWAAYCGTADEITKYEQEIDRETAVAEGRGDANLKETYAWRKASLAWFKELPANYAEINANPHPDNNTFVYYKTDTGEFMYVPLKGDELSNSPVGNSNELRQQLEELGFQPHLLHFPPGGNSVPVEKNTLFCFASDFAGFKYKKLMNGEEEVTQGKTTE